MTQRQYARSTKYLVLRNVTFPNSAGKLVIAKAGDIVTDYPPTSARLDVRDGVLEHYEEEKGKEGDE